tara:strand:- start:711 stop:953 length:243 start_codon:yes stop_codon:yes gene_type:complete
MLGIFKQDTRPPKNGWWSGHYMGNCRNCSKQFIGAKGAYICADCAYGYDEQLQYEQLWREFGWTYTAEYYTKVHFKNSNK